jgi:hypothetical protein
MTTPNSIKKQQVRAKWPFQTEPPTILQSRCILLSGVNGALQITNMSGGTFLGGPMLELPFNVSLVQPECLKIEIAT